MYIDLFITVIFVWAAYSGWRNGFVKEIISAIGLLAGLLVAATFYETLGEYLAVDGSQVNMLTSILAFFILWVIVPIVLGLVANMLTKALKGMKLGLPNSLLGLAASVVKCTVLLSCVFNMMSVLHILDESKKEGSHFYAPVEGALTVLFDKAVTTLSDDASGSSADTVWVDVSREEASDDSL